MAFYQSEIVTLRPSGNPAGLVVPNVQSISTAFQVARRDSLRLGRFAPTPYRMSEQDPLINVSVDFIPTGKDIFAALGMMGAGSVIDNMSSGTQKYNDMTVQMRQLVGGGSSIGTISLRTGVVTNYSFQASVNQTPKTTLALEFVDIGMDAVTAVVPPTINDAYPTLRSQDIDIQLPTGVFGITTIFPQNFSITLPLNRTQINRIGQRKPVSRDLASPVIASFQIQAIVDTFASTPDVSGNSLFNLTCGAPIAGTISVNVKTPTCTGASTQSLVQYNIRNPYLDNVSFSNAVGGYTTVDLTFTCPVTPDNLSTESNVSMV